jgi:Carboxypeptidase regulatory-like domain/TonB dependent receptor
MKYSRISGGWLGCSKRAGLGALLLALSLGVPALAQSVAEISGTVQDQTGAAVAGAIVKLTQVQTSFSRSVLTEANGDYAAVNLPIGPYVLEVAQAGFSPYKQTGIVLEVNTNPKINVVLAVGNVATEVNVEASTVSVETVSNAVGTVMENQSIVDLPLNGRQVTDLMLLQPGAVLNGSPLNRGFPVSPIAIGGGGVANNLYLLDGATHNDPATNLNLPVPFPDALEEFKIEDSSLPARFGQHASAAVSLVTKSGTNDLHWVAFEFVRNRDFNARNFFALSRDPQKRNQFGGSFGGPIIHDKLFFFAAYQGTILRNDPSTSVTTVPTAAEMAGNFTTVTSPQCNGGKTVTLKTPVGTSIPITNNIVDPANYDPAALAYMKYIPLSTDPCGKIQYGYPTPNHENDFLGKVDYQKSDKHSMFVRFFSPHYIAPAYFNGVNALTTPSVGVNNVAYSLVGGDTYLFNPNTINTFHATLLIANNVRSTIPFISPTDAGANVYSTPNAANFTSLSITGGFSLGGGGNNPAAYNYAVGQFSDTIDIVHGAHQLAFGADFIPGSGDYHNTQYSNGQYSFDGSQTGYGLLDFLLGRVATFVQAPDGQRHDRSYYFGLFAQDTWKVTRRLTVNAGLRWDPYLPFSNQNTVDGLPAQVLQFSQANFNAGKVSSVYTSAPAGLIFPGDAGYTGGSKSFNSSHFANFAPRIGIVFDPRGQGKETIRAGYGIFYDSPSLWNYNYFDTEAPWAPMTGLKSVQFSNPYATYPGGNPFPLKLSANSVFPTQANYLLENPQTTPTYMQQWNISLQKQFFSNLLVTATYMGNKTTHLWVGIDANPAVYIPGNCAAGVYGLTAAGACSTSANTNQRRLLSLQNPAIGQYYAQINFDNQGGNANYNAAMLSVQKRLSSHFSVLGNYTFSHCINEGEATSGGALLSGNPNYSNPFDADFDRGNCATNRQSVLNLSGALTTPNFKGRLLHSVVTGWQISPILQASSGAPLNFVSGRDVALTGASSGQRLNLVGDPNLSNPTTSLWFNTAAFASPATGTFGNIGRNALNGPGYYVINLALSRRIAVREKHVIELRAEAFNILNHAHLDNPNTTLSSALFGQITTAEDPRILQFAIKYTH